MSLSSSSSRAAMQNGSWICQPNKHLRSRGIFFGDSPFAFATPVLLAQLSLSAFLTALLQYVLTPLGESAFISQMLVGILLGPSFLGKERTIIDAIFPSKSFYISETFAFFGCMFFMFLVGVKMDLGMVKKSGKKAIAIGLSVFFVPLILNTAFAISLQSFITNQPHLRKSLISIAIFQSSSSFYVIACLLADLKLLNSELGRLALSSSMISGMVSWSWIIIGFTARQTSLGPRSALPWMALSLFCLVFLILYILRPIMVWMMNNALKGKATKESCIFYLFIMVLGCALFGEFIGQHFMLGPMLLGLAVPDGPPIGSALVEKLESFVSSIWLPGYFVFSGARINLSMVEMKTVGIVQMLALCSFMGKLVGTMVPALYCKMPLMDALCLGLIMSAQGITDILILQHGMLLRMIDAQSYSIMVITTILITGTITPIVKIMYNPSKIYKSSKRSRRTIEHTAPDAELRLLICLYHQDSTPSIINLLQVSNPTMKSPICFYLVHLMQLSGRSSPLLITHKPGKHNSLHSNFSDHIINAFRLFQQHNNGKVIMNAFTSIAPYATMHDDVCMLALEKRTSMVIVPFHKQRTLHGTEESANPVRGVNRNILSKAPCSVGILVDRGTLTALKSLSSQALYRIGVFFVEGPDDRETLAYSMRMAEHRNVGLTVVNLIDPSRIKSRHEADWELDSNIIEQFKTTIARQKRHDYKEEIVNDSVDMINVIRTNENSFDLIMVGRRHDGESPLFMGLTDFNEFPELGFIGDMLASSDSNCEVSVLVVQQQSIGGDQEISDSFRCILEESFDADDHVRVWPKAMAP